MINHDLRVAATIFTILALMSALPAYAAENEAIRAQLALEGYSPVSYYEQGHPEKGSRDHQSTYQGNVYWFTGAAQKDAFDANPTAYAPSFPRSCPYNLAQGRLETIDPTNFKIVDGQLLLFHRSTERDGLRQWEESISSSRITEKELLRRAKGNFLDLKF
tara:strand:+ start:32546 stop:33028 length:483 start_codon:yes stop_codon:yes gene_type:complete